MDSIESARQLFGAENFDRAAEICSRLIERDGEDAAAWNLLAWCEHQKGNRQRAVEGAVEATRHRDDAWRYFHDLGYFLRHAQADERAVGAFSRAVELESGAVPSWVQLGAALTSIGKLDDAIAAHRRAVKIDFTAATQSLLALVELDRFGQRPEELRVLEKAFKTIRVGRERSQLGFALGQVWERRKDVPKSFEYYDGANRDRRRDGHLDVAAKLAATPSYLDQFNQEAMLSARHSEMDSRRPVFIVGMPRSGTTLLERLLGQHPNVDTGGESGEFARLVGGVVRQLPANVPLLEGLTPAVLHATASSYLDYLQRRFPGDSLVTEKLPLNFTLVGIIAKLFPEGRVIYLQRHFLDTCWSCWTTSFDHPTLAFTQTELGQFHALYEHTMAHWEQVCPERMTAVVYEELVREPESTMRTVVSDLGLEWDDACANIDPSVGGAIRTASAVTARRPVTRSSIGRSRAYRDRLTALTEARDAALAALRS